MEIVILLYLLNYIEYGNVVRFMFFSCLKIHICTSYDNCVLRNHIRIQ